MFRDTPAASGVLCDARGKSPSLVFAMCVFYDNISDFSHF